MWSWLFHRLTGVGVLLFLLIHIVDTALILFGPDVYNHMVALYKKPFFRPLEVALLAALLYHALNGIRICLVDFWPNLARFHAQIFFGVMVLFCVLFFPAAYLMMRALF